VITSTIDVAEPNDNAARHPVLGAVLINYRRADLTRRCVSSLLGQVDYIIVVDNSDSIAEAMCLQEALTGIARDSKTIVKTLVSHANVGFARGIQLGVDALTDMLPLEAILVINNDAQLGVSAVTALWQAMRASRDPMLVAPRETTDGVPSMLWYQRTLALVSRRRLPGSFAYISGACLLIPRQLLSTPLFDAEFFMYGEDVEFSWRLAKSGVTLATVECVFAHAANSSSGTSSLFYEYHTVRGHILLARKLAYNLPDRIMLTLCRAITLPLRALMRSARVWSFTPIRALLQAATQPTVSRKPLP
jgi:GT2 family glycosyltransferase